jgi:hypothetical protein
MDTPPDFPRSARARTLRPGLFGSWLVMGAAASCLLACSDAELTQTPSFSDRYPAATQTGVFRAGNVAGLHYVSGNETGVTDARGRFTCTTGQPVAFSLGSVELGDTVCATLAHPAALTASGSLMDPAAINMTRLLLMLDHDQVFENGIEISAALRTLADHWPAIDFSAADFEAELVTVISDVASAEDRANVAVPSSAEAFAYLDASLECAYSGVFVNTFAAGFLTQLTHADLTVYPESGSGMDVFEMRIRRDHPQSQLYLQADGTLELKALPILINGSQTGTGSISADYRTPDVVTGSWANGIAQQGIDRTGIFEVVRIGSALGDYRFTGTFSRDGDTGTPVRVGAVALTLDGDTLTGESFNLSLGAAFPVSGTRLPGSNTVRFTAEPAADSASAELLTDASGAPIGLQGAWPGLPGGVVDAVGCHLN